MKLATFYVCNSQELSDIQFGYLSLTESTDERGWESRNVLLVLINTFGYAVASLICTLKRRSKGK